MLLSLVSWSTCIEKKIHLLHKQDCLHLQDANIPSPLCGLFSGNAPIFHGESSWRFPCPSHLRSADLCLAKRYPTCQTCQGTSLFLHTIFLETSYINSPSPLNLWGKPKKAEGVILLISLHDSSAMSLQLHLQLRNLQTELHEAILSKSLVCTSCDSAVLVSFKVIELRFPSDFIVCTDSSDWKAAATKRGRAVLPCHTTYWDQRQASVWGITERLHWSAVGSTSEMLVVWTPFTTWEVTIFY